jgi:hypothetical protein
VRRSSTSPMTLSMHHAAIGMCDDFGRLTDAETLPTSPAGHSQRRIGPDRTGVPGPLNAATNCCAWWQTLVGRSSILASCGDDQQTPTFLSLGLLLLIAAGPQYLFRCPADRLILGQLCPRPPSPPRRIVEVWVLGKRGPT